MSESETATLTVAITARALFDLEHSHGLYEREGVAAYTEFQRDREDDMLAPGIAFPLVRKLLALNEGRPANAPRRGHPAFAQFRRHRPAHLQFHRALR